MARYKDKSKAILLRKKGYSYSQIKEELGISKSTLSNWLQDYPLSEKRIRQLTADSPKRIEKYINTMKKKREEKFSLAFEKVKKEIENITKRELYIAGFFLYWAEGGKTRNDAIVLTNTDPAMLRIYIKWLEILNISKDKLKIKLHIYKDMNEEDEIRFWCKELGLDKTQFQKTRIKDSRMVDLNYRNNFGHGTCNIIYNNTVTAMYVLMGIKFIANVIGVGNIDNMRA